MNRTFGPGSPPLRGTIHVPGDKSLSHRAVLFSAMAEGVSSVSGVLDSADVRSTIAAVAALGARVDLSAAADGSLGGVIEGWGSRGPLSPAEPIDCGNSGTTARLLMGVLAGWPVTVTLTGDESLSARPMARVTAPLTEMGAAFSTSEGGRLPVTVHGRDGLHAIDYASPVASAQVKTAVLLAGLRASGMTSVTEPSLSRDHTERLLPAFGVTVSTNGRTRAGVLGQATPAAAEVAVPRDPSSAAFLAVAGATIPGSEIVLPGVSLNPTRLGFLAVLQRMNADVTVQPEPSAGAEPVGTITVRYGPPLHPTTVAGEEVPSLVDEVPVLALAAAQARGTTRFEGIGELRVKESDRLEAVHSGLAALGVTVRAGDDWLEVDGPAALGGARLDSLGDHRLAMTWALAGMIARDQVDVLAFDAVDVSYPAFAQDLTRLAGNRSCA